ncbi:hypothetical protein SAY87_000164 [Trapa incisa]|uniref:Uncharacterized protein n=1 Tax=Trapa incisa TaxID=236973 RepID=A0AAN7JGY8_9MYRT|nr:hypothetical protein SAY87_000164 [Trapa incisa]
MAQKLITLLPVGITHGENFNGSEFALKPGTGSCGSSLNCTAPGSPPASMVEFILGDVGYYDVSLVDCFNISTIIIPVKGKQNCTIVGCHGDLMKNCLVELALYTSDKVIGCRSACYVYSHR